MNWQLRRRSVALNDGVIGLFRGQELILRQWQAVAQ